MGWKKIAGFGIATLIIFLLGFNSAIGYVGNAITDQANRDTWLWIAAIVCITTGLVEILKEEKGD